MTPQLTSEVGGFPCGYLRRAVVRLTSLNTPCGNRINLPQARFAALLLKRALLVEGAFGCIHSMEYPYLIR